MSEMEDQEFESATECYENYLGALIDSMREGEITQSQQKKACEIINEAAVKLGLIHGEIEYTYRHKR